MTFAAVDDLVQEFAFTFRFKDELHASTILPVCARRRPWRVQPGSALANDRSFVETAFCVAEPLPKNKSPSTPVQSFPFGRSVAVEFRRAKESNFSSQYLNFR
jgi:hypothetical protein